MTPEAIRKLCMAIAAISVLAGGFGSLLCLPYACSSNWTVVAATGIYFVAGAVMITGGLMAFAQCQKMQG